jgi:hypothetical protein
MVAQAGCVTGPVSGVFADGVTKRVGGTGFRAFTGGVSQ